MQAKHVKKPLLRSPSASSALPSSHVWHPNTQMSEWEKFDSISRGDGIWLVDSKGRKMIDGVASMWCNVWGHSNKELVDAMTSQMQKLQHSPLFNLTHNPAETLARKLVKMSPGMHSVLYSDNGSTAMEIALKMAFQYWTNNGDKTRTAVASLDRGYHGDTFGAMSIGQIPEFFSQYGQHQICKSVSLPVPTQTPASKYGTRRANDSKHNISNNKGLHDFTSEISDILAGRNDIAALVMESGAQIAGGVRIYARNFQRQVSRMCKKHDILLIVDEVATGFGRLGPMCVYSNEDSKPDMVAYGKMMTGGYLPLAATLSTKRIYDSFLGDYDQMRHLFHGHTFTGNPLAAAVANKNIAMYAKHHLIRHIAKAARIFDNYVDPLLGLDAVGDIRHKGMIMGIELVADKATSKPVCPAPSMNYIMYKTGRKNGVYLRTLGNVVMVVPPLAISKQELAMLLERTLKTIKEATPALRRAK